jgi:hypothetical protein
VEVRTDKVLDNREGAALAEAVEEYLQFATR